MPSIGLGLTRPASFDTQSAYTTTIEPFSIQARPSMIATAGVARSIEDWKWNREPGEPGSPPPFVAIAMRGLPGSGAPDHGLFGITLFARSRDDMDGEPPRLNLRPFFMAISPESYWEDGILGNSTQVFSFSEAAPHHEVAGASTDRSGPNPGERDREQEGRSTSLAASSLPVSASSGMPGSNVMIWVDAETWAGESSLASVVLSRGELEPGAMFPHEEPPELTALISSLMNELLGETGEFSMPLSGPFQQITTLDPLDESSLALTATLLTVASDTQGGVTRGPATAEADSTSDASLPAPPSWAGFVIGLDEAFEANRIAVRRWPEAAEPRGEVRGRRALNGSPAAAAADHAATDEALQELGRDAPAPDALDELFLRVLEAEDEDSTKEDEPSWANTAARASFTFPMISALWAERLHSRRARRENPPEADSPDEKR